MLVLPAESLYPYSLQNNAEHAEIVYNKNGSYLLASNYTILTSSKSDSLPEWPAIDVVISEE